MNDQLTQLLNKREPLCDELAACCYIDARLKTQVIKHPLIVEVFHVDEMNALINERLRQKRARVDELIAERRLEAVLGYYERPFRLDGFKHLAATHKIPLKVCGEMLAWIWIDSENIHENLNDWRALLKKYKKQIRAAMEPEDKKTLKELPDRFKVYRGHQGINKAGLSWTLSRERAERFANRFKDKRAAVAERTILKTEVHFYTNARSEQEIVIL